MSIRTDGGLAGLFRQHLKGNAHWQRIETWASSGVPDTNYCIDGAEGWVEMKKARGNQVKFEEFQVPWITQRGRAGGRVFVAVRKTIKSEDTLWLFPWTTVPILAQEGLPKPEGGSFLDGVCLYGTNGPASWDWDRVRETLTA